ncbi:hypothetical protein CKAH01_16996 [Colletotrichum kahawae]|uniref:Nephrocystin 3-like N-terminal domain-containing protein n=1 Tax=Colletotrichum kahawae TaxID=34407 RepID=A0AAD9YDN3_COLKA|nr:hypothetical protein CKAH01_16996 [Colletotrichum kahawae]
MYTIGWIVALDKELTAALAMLDETHQQPDDFEQNDKDSNTYSWGRIGDHNIVIASLGGGSYGLVSAATTATCMANSLPHLRFGLMVGIGAGVPSSEEDDVRLGDVVVSLPKNGHPGVIQYDLGRMRENDHFQRVGALAPPPTILLKALDKLRASQRLKGSKLPQILSQTFQNYPMLANPKGKDPAFTYQGSENDRLFEPTSLHVSGQSCSHCDAEREINREERSTNDPEVHYGTIASGNLVIKDGVFRDHVLERLGTDVLCYEMEAAGLMNSFPCLVIRGVCDYADTHKNDRWQNYAAIVAAAYAKELLSVIDARSVERAEKMEEAMAAVSRAVSRIESTTNDTQQTVQRMAHKQLQQEIVTWLAAPDPSGDQNAAFQQHHPDTGQWFLEGEEYQQWHMTSASCLWLHGMMGCGKTILSSAIINDLEGRETDTQHLLFFYFTFSDDRKRSLDGVIRSLINQLSSKNDAARKQLTAIFDSKYRGAGDPKQASTKSLCEIFKILVEVSGRIWIVLDALDECHLGSTFANEGLLMWLKCIVGQKHDNLRIIVTSRRDTKIRLVLDDLSPVCHQICLQSSMVNNDIRTLIHTTIKTWTSLKEWEGHEEVQKEIADHLIRKAQGIWVACQLYALEAVAGCRDYVALKDALHSLPKTLNETYARVLNNIPDVLRARAQTVLQFLLYSTVPLLAEEATEITQIFPQATRLKRRLNTSTKPDVNAISAFCPSLVEFVTQEGKNGTRIKFLRLSHFSVKEYLLSELSETYTSWAFGESLAQASMAETCLAYLLEIRHDQPLDAILSSYPLALHAANFWVDYACQARNAMNTRLVREFVRDKYVHKIYRELINSNDYTRRSHFGRYGRFRSNNWSYSNLYLEDRRQHDIYGPLLYYFSCCGLLCAVKETLLVDLDAVKFQSSKFSLEAPLQAAAVRGHHQVVNCLLSHGADANTQGGHYGHAIQAAAAEGYHEIVKDLLSYGADVNAQGGNYGNALQAAAAKGYHEIVKDLLSHGADVNAQGGHYGNALMAAVKGHDGTTVAFLLEKDANVDENVLSFAALDCNTSIVNMLLDKSFTVSKEIFTNACRKGDVAIINRLLRRISSRETVAYCSSALLSTLPGGKSGVAITSITRYAEISPRDEKGHTSLYHAVVEKQMTVVESLIENGAKLPQEDDDYIRLITVITIFGSITFVRRWLTSHKSVQLFDEMLRGASSHGKLDAVTLALEKFEAGHQTEAKRISLTRALAAAIRGSNGDWKGVVRLLLDNGADANTDVYVDYHNAPQESLICYLLKNSARWKHKRKLRTVVDLLIEHGADPDKGSGPRGSAVDAAIWAGWLEMADLFIERGAKITARYEMMKRAKFGETQLQDASTSTWP